jgi:hypothetical protein
MLQVAELDGRLKPEFAEDYGELIDLEPGTLDPVWWPWAVQGEGRTPAQRHADFSINLDDMYRALKKSAESSSPPPPSDFPYPTLENSKPHLVLRALLWLRAAALPDDRPTFD